MKVNVPQMSDIEQTTELTDYREADGIRLPCKLIASSSLQSYTVDISRVGHNGPVDGKVFVKP